MYVTVWWIITTPFWVQFTFDDREGKNALTPYPVICSHKVSVICTYLTSTIGANRSAQVVLHAYTNHSTKVPNPWLFSHHITYLWQRTSVLQTASHCTCSVQSVYVNGKGSSTHLFVLSLVKMAAVCWKMLELMKEAFSEKQWVENLLNLASVKLVAMFKM